MEVKKVAKEQKIWDEEEKAVKSEKEAKQLVLERFHRQIKVFCKKASVNANKEDIGLYDRFEGEICTKERESVPLVQRRERGNKRVYLGVDKEGIYKTIKIIIDGTSILCRKEGWKEENSAGLLVFE